MEEQSTRKDMADITGGVSEKLVIVAGDEDLPEHFIQAHDPLPSISPRDKLSYVDDKKLYKEIQQFDRDSPGLSKLVALMHNDVLRDKPDNVLNYIIDVFFAEAHQLMLRKEIGDTNK
jgi:hypothetical protein